MLEKPNLPDEAIIKCLNQYYGLTAVGLEFLPIGNDATAWVYKVSAVDAVYFLKLKQGQISPASLSVPHFLYESGIKQIVTPIANQSSELSTPLQRFTLILYPFIEGQSGMQISLSLDQWRELGTILQQMHTSHFPSEIMEQVPRESFTPRSSWMQIVESLQRGLSETIFKDKLEEELAAFCRTHTDEIAHIISRTHELGRLVQAQQLPYVLCHADIHTANVLVDGVGQLYIVDWDGTLFAPKERDLMFVVGGRSADSPLNESERAFLSGYRGGDTMIPSLDLAPPLYEMDRGLGGEDLSREKQTGNKGTDINWLAMAYYRYEWVVQEFADFAERVFFTPDIGLETKEDAVRGFKQLFLPGDVITSAYALESYLI